MNLLVQKTGYLAALAIAGSCALVAFRGPNGVPALMEKQRQISILQEQNATLTAENLRRAERIRKLQHDRSAQEMEIRKRLKLLRPGETQFILPDQKPDTP